MVCDRNIVFYLGVVFVVFKDYYNFYIFKRFFVKVYLKMEILVIVIVLFGVFVVFLVFIFDFEVLVEMMFIGILLVYIIVVLCVLLFCY